MSIEIEYHQGDDSAAKRLDLKCAWLADISVQKKNILVQKIAPNKSLGYNL